MLSHAQHEGMQHSRQTCSALPMVFLEQLFRVKQLLQLCRQSRLCALCMYETLGFEAIYDDEAQ